jgi:hypothetical protein
MTSRWTCWEDFPRHIDITTSGSTINLICLDLPRSKESDLVWVESMWLLLFFVYGVFSSPKLKLRVMRASMPYQLLVPK